MLVNRWPDGRPLTPQERRRIELLIFEVADSSEVAEGTSPFGRTDKPQAIQAGWLAETNAVKGPALPLADQISPM